MCEKVGVGEEARGRSRESKSVRDEPRHLGVQVRFDKRQHHIAIADIFDIQSPLPHGECSPSVKCSIAAYQTARVDLLDSKMRKAVRVESVGFESVDRHNMMCDVTCQRFS